MARIVLLLLPPASVLVPRFACLHQPVYVQDQGSYSIATLINHAEDLSLLELSKVDEFWRLDRAARFVAHVLLQGLHRERGFVCSEQAYLEAVTNHGLCAAAMIHSLPGLLKAAIVAMMTLDHACSRFANVGVRVLAICANWDDVLCSIMEALRDLFDSRKAATSLQRPRTFASSAAVRQ